MPSGQTKPVADGAAPNNFDALRLLAALMVVLGHGFELKQQPTLTLWNFPVSVVGVKIFFCISGYLITESWRRNPRLPAFAAKRALRVLPALLVSVALTAFVIGPLDTVLPLRRYLTHHLTWQYLENAAFYLRLNLPGVFEGRVHDGAVNGALWSLSAEVLCYASVPLLALLPFRPRIAVLLAAIAVTGSYGLFLLNHPEIRLPPIYGESPTPVLMVVPYFLSGALLRLVQSRIRGLFRLDVAMIALAGYFYAAQLLDRPSVPLEWLCLPYIVIAFGLHSTPVLRRAARFGDLSYGTYVYAWPVQQLLLQHVHSFAITLCALCTLALAWLSWHLVEAPALRLKPRGLPAITVPQALAA